MKYQKCECCGANIDITKDGVCPYYSTHYKVKKVVESKIVNNENESNETELLSKVFERK